MRQTVAKMMAEDQTSVPEGIENKIAAAILELPLLPEKAGHVGFIACRIAVALPTTMGAHRFASSRGSERELQRVRKAAQALHDVLAGLSAEAYRQLRMSEALSRPTLKMEGDLESLARAADIALLTHQPKRATKGRPKLQSEAGISDLIRRSYESLTGLPATVTTDPLTSVASGTFLDFLGKIFKILDIDASPESQARSTIDRAKEKKS